MSRHTFVILARDANSRSGWFLNLASPPGLMEAADGGEYRDGSSDFSHGSGRLLGRGRAHAATVSDGSSSDPQRDHRAFRLCGNARHRPESRLRVVPPDHSSNSELFDESKACGRLSGSRATIDMVPCRARGTVTFTNGRRGRWEVEQARFGNLVVEGRPKILLYTASRLGPLFSE